MSLNRGPSPYDPVVGGTLNPSSLTEMPYATKAGNKPHGMHAGGMSNSTLADDKLHKPEKPYAKNAGEEPATHAGGKPVSCWCLRMLLKSCYKC